MKLLVMIVALSFVSNAFAGVRCPSNVDFEEAVMIQDQNTDIELLLNGVGLKKVLFFNVFYGALYLEDLNSDGQDIVDNNETKVIMVHALRNISEDQLVDNWTQEFERLCDDKCDELQEYHDQFISNARDVDKHERLTVTFKSDRVEYDDGTGTEFDPIMSVEYGKIMLASSVGDDAEDSRVKKGMLGEDKKLCKKI